MRTITVKDLARDAKEFLRFKRAMGITYQRGEHVVDSFLRFVGQRWGSGNVELDTVVRQWCARRAGCKAVTVANEFGVVRQLCLYRRRYDPSGYVPEHALAPVKESIFQPYIFSHDEVRQILALASRHRDRSIWAGMLRPLILILYCTGMRLGEAARLHTTDVDLDRGTLMIRRSKGRSRLVVIRADLVTELRSYVAQRQRLVCDLGRPDPAAFFLRLNASGLTVRSASDVIRRLLRSWGSSLPRAGLARVLTSFAMPLPFIVSRPGPKRAPIFTPSCLYCRPISAI